MSFRRRALLGHSFGRMLRGRGAQFGEDVDLSLQVRRSGWKVTYDPAVAVDHFPGRLPSNVDHRRLADLESLFDASHNDSVMMLDYLTPARRVAFLLWGVLVGTRLLPGFVVALHQGLGQGDWSGWRRSRVVRRARWLGFRRWLADRRKADPAASPIPIDRKPPTICIVTHVVQPGDGQGRVILRLANHLLDRGHQLTLVASEVESALSERAGLTWIRVPVPHRVPHALRWIWFAIVARLKLTRSLRQTFDVVHLNGAIVPVPADLNTAHFVHATWRRIAGKAPRLSLYQRFLARVCAATEAMAFRSARMVTAVSDAVERSLVRDVGLAARVVRVVYNGVDTVEFRPREPGEPSELRQELGLVGNEFLVLFVGDAKTSRKNLDCAIEAISRLPDRFHLAVIGAFEGGPYPNRAKSLGVSHRVRFLGLREDVAVCLRGGDLLFCASRYDPASLVLLEGLASGVPILSCPDVGNAAFIQSGKNGFLIEDWSDVAGAVRVIRALDLDPRRAAAVGEAGRETALELSWERMGAHYECLYQALLVPRVTGDVGRLPPERTLALPVEAQR